MRLLLLLDRLYSLRFKAFLDDYIFVYIFVFINLSLLNLLRCIIIHIFYMYISVDM